MKLLEGVEVLDVGRYVAGPYCATLLGYLGARVTRIERRDGGEDRYIAPLFTRGERPGEGGLFMQTGCGKRSVAIDVSKPDGLRILARLAEKSDVVVANATPAALAKLGLDWPAFSARNPRGILVTQTGFGSSGPDAAKGGFDGVAQAMSGAMCLTGTPEHPVKAGAPYADFSTAVFSALGALAALMAREASGAGQHVETSLLGTALAVMNSHLAEQAVTQINRPGTGNRVQTSAPSDVFETLDGHILVHTVGDGIFRRWAKLIGKPALAEQPEYQGDQARGDRRDELCGIMAAWCIERTTDEALSELAKAGVPSGPVLTQQQALDNPQVAAMEFFRMVDFPGLQTQAPVADLPIRFSALAAGIAGRPPLLGEHTREALLEIGYSDQDIDALSRDGVI
ncbi:MAG: CoA transferase [Alphaproteobacteria bacterium]|nr:CoA transferase [Alphaproteobacteria bacterium]